MKRANRYGHPAVLTDPKYRKASLFKRQNRGFIRTIKYYEVTVVVFGCKRKCIFMGVDNINEHPSK